MFTICDSYGKAKLADIERHVAQEQQVLEFLEESYRYQGASVPRISYAKKIKAAVMYFLATFSMPPFEC